ncbi:MAG: tetratricopeptide repeat protein [Bryobacteraceae bacterium]
MWPLTVLLGLFGGWGTLPAHAPSSAREGANAVFSVHVILEDGSPPPGAPRARCSRGHARVDRDGGYSASLAVGSSVTFSLRGFGDRKVWACSPGSAKWPLHIVLSRRGIEGDLWDRTLKSVPVVAGQAFGEGEAAMGRKKWTEAEGLLRKAVKLYPNHALAWDELGQALEKQGQAEGVRQAYEAAIAAAATLARAWHESGQALEKQGKTQEANAAYEAASTANAILARPLVHLAGLAIERRQWSEAAALTDRAISLEMGVIPRAMFYNAVAKFNLGLMDEAAESAVNTIVEDKRRAFPFAEYVLRAALLKKGETPAAVQQRIRELKKQARQPPPNGKTDP